MVNNAQETAKFMARKGDVDCEALLAKLYKANIISKK
jgi:hypothetical protein